MSLTVYNLPCGKIYVNKTKIEQGFYDQGRLIKLKPNQVHFAGASQLDLLHYLISPSFWESSQMFEKLLKKEGEVRILIDSHMVSRYGDNLMLTILPKGYVQFHPKNVSVDVWVSEPMKPVWENNPWIHKIITEESETKEFEYGMTVDLNRVELRFKNNRKCSDVILETAGLHMVNRTPVYVSTTEEKKWAKLFLKGVNKPILGVASYSYAQLRTWPYMDDLIKEYLNRGWFIIQLDKRDSEEKYRFTFRQMAALMERCNLVAVNDSAALHLAGALKKRTIGVFGHTDGVRISEDYEKAIIINSKTCSKAPCWWSVPCLEGEHGYHEKESKGPMKCLTDLKLEDVLQGTEVGLKKVRKVLAVMLTYNMLDWTKLALDSIRTFHDCDVFVVDNESSDGTQEWLKSQGVEFVSKRQGVAAAQNAGLDKFYSGDYDYFLLLNNDIALRYDTIDKLVEILERDPKLSAVTSQEVLDIQPWLIDSVPPRSGPNLEIVDIPPSAYSCTMFRRDILEKIGKFDAHFTPRYIEDNDYNLRIRLAGGKFIKTQESIYYHLLGGVLSTNEMERRERDIHWVKNIAYYQEKWGIHPHSHQDLARLGIETRPGQLVGALDSNKNKFNVLVKRGMGGWGDIIFITVVARELKKKYGDRVKVFYDVPEKYRGVIQRYPYIDGQVTTPDVTLDLTDVEFRAEWQEIAKYGRILSARTETHLRIAGLPTDNLHPDYFVTADESRWAKEQWDKFKFNTKKIVIVPEGSNLMKNWHGMEQIFQPLILEGYRVILSTPQTTDFYMTSALISEADLVISPDTGLSNVAGALNIPVITIFSNRNPEPFIKMFSTMIPLRGDCPKGCVDGCDYKVPCAETEGPYRPKENSIGEPGCFKNLEPSKVLEVVKEILS